MALHPEHFLPGSSALTAYERANGQASRQSHVSAPDRTLRKSPGTNDCPRFPTFCYEYARSGVLSLNAFLVILNADVKFRRYLKMPTPANPLPADVMELIHKTVELVDLIYWKPAIRPGTYAEECFQEYAATDLNYDSDDSQVGMRIEESILGTQQVFHSVGGHGSLLSGSTLQERREYGQYLLSGRGKPSCHGRPLHDLKIFS